MRSNSDGRRPVIKGFSLLVIVFFIASLNFTLDRLSKNYAVEHIKGQGTIQVVGNIFILHYAENDGAFLGFGGGLPKPLKTFLLILLPVVLIVASTIYTAFSGSLPPGQIVCLSSIIGGGAGNLFDRIFNDGTVIDFLNFGIGGLRTGILNVADLSVTFGAVLLIILQLRQSKAQAAGD
ncbi:MAG: signal peptidase II [Spirochaetales bacterium]|nr:signal peptidase II [Spirochaetales bacterium]